MIVGGAVSILQWFLQQAYAFQTPRLLVTDLYGQVQFLQNLVVFFLSLGGKKKTLHLAFGQPFLSYEALMIHFSLAKDCEVGITTAAV